MERLAGAGRLKWGFSKCRVNIGARACIKGCIGGAHLEAVAGYVDEVSRSFGISEVGVQRVVVFVVPKALAIKNCPVAGTA